MPHVCFCLGEYETSSTNACDHNSKGGHVRNCLQHAKPTHAGNRDAKLQSQTHLTGTLNSTPRRFTGGVTQSRTEAHASQHHVTSHSSGAGRRTPGTARPAATLHLWTSVCLTQRERQACGAEKRARKRAATACATAGRCSARCCGTCCGNLCTRTRSPT